ncbi:hypothetical protein PTTG_03280 [Puccinia triticina 1-1 BBBD Race 1]|uniref:Uncharacterized protein n=1 Tax=Puccinia triticina (isolate 1-1 / race 1 (BBBD)) TaxID=630390 RepID=A0A180GHI4_PUCT1|nr:hypothetical protein PTTG_03280 [Puccinia triticina 1-1 BBBD Race 1]
MDVDEFLFTSTGDNTPEERPAGEVPLETLAEGSNRRRRTIKSRTQDRQTNQNLSRIITQAADKKPHHRDKVIRSLQTFTRAMMGLPPNAKPHELPDSVTEVKLASWDTWRERRKEAFSKQLEEVTKKNPNANEQEIKLIRKTEIDHLKTRLVPVAFRLLPFAATLAVSIHVKRDMEVDLAKNGFPRFTFDWNARFAQDSVWNAVTVGITVRHWLPWAKHINVDVLESVIPGIKTRFFEWVGNQGLTRVKAQVTPADIANLRADTFLSLYPAKKILGHLLRDPDAVSDFEEDDANSLPRQITAYWRSAQLEKIIRCIDRAALQRAKTPQKKMLVKGLLDRKDTRSPTAEERIEQTVPNCFPRNTYGDNYLQEVGEFQAEHIASEHMELDPLATEMLAKSSGASNSRPPVQGSSHSTGPQQAALAASNQAGSSGPEVQMAG